MRNAGRLGIVTSGTVVLVFIGGSSALPAWSQQTRTDDHGSSCIAIGDAQPTSLRPASTTAGCR
jgi:hypothetical protein